jgi:hypothetical protein
MTRSLRAGIAGAVLFVLAACGTSLSPPAPATPAPTDIVTEQQSLGKFTGTPEQYLDTGVELWNRWCSAYLNALTQSENTMNFAAGAVSATGSAASGIAAVSGAGLPATAIMGIVFPAISQELVAEGKMVTAGQPPGAVWIIVQNEQAKYLQAVQAAPPTTVPAAASAISTYSTYCQPVGIQSAVLQGLVKSTVSSPAASATAKAALAPIAVPGLFVPPVVTVNGP